MHAEQKREFKRAIDVILTDGSSYQIQPEVLDVLLDNNRVLKFKRAKGWVIVGVDPVRAKRRNNSYDIYYGPERRYSAH
jgi:hypothetical protein